MTTSSRLVARLLALLLLLATLVALGGAPPAGAADGGAGAGSKRAAVAAAAEPGQLAITVTTSDDADLDTTVDVYRWEEDGQYFDYYDSTDVWGASPAEATLTLPSGFYYTEAYDWNGEYETGYGNGAAGPATELGDPGVVQVSGEAGADVEIVLERLAEPNVTGTIVTPQGDPVSDVDVVAERLIGGEPADEAGYDYSEDGTYALRLDPGSYRISTGDEDLGFDSADVTVGDNPVVVPPLVLTPPTSYVVSGSVQDQTGAPLAGYAELYRLIGEPGAFEDADWVSDVDVDTDGSYALPGARAGQYYTVLADADGHEARYLGGASSALEADAVLVEGDVTVDPIVLPENSAIAGVVSGPDGPVADIEARLYVWDDVDEEFYEDDEAYTEEDGSFTLPVDEGIYAVYFDAEDADQPLRSQWYGGGAAPDSPTDPGVFTVAGAPRTYRADQTLARAQVVTGTLTDQAGATLADGSVVLYAWDGESWSQEDAATSRDDGTFAVRAPASSTVTLRASRGGFSPVFYGGGRALPASPDATNSLPVPAAGDVAAGTLVLPPFQSRLGTVAGQKIDYCLDSVVPANDDGSSDEVAIPFDLTFFGTPYDSLYVNNNGNVTFGSDLSEYTPHDLTGQTDLPIIAPFFADVDTRGAGSNVVTYGTSPDGRTLCVNWADVGYYSSYDDKLNTFQLLLTSSTAGAGRVDGDFDITFNYDEVLWETGDASDGVDGFGGTSAAAGFSAGSGVPGTFVQLPGSFVNGALLDGGPQALVDGSQGSTQRGRYVFQVRNDGAVSVLGGLTGTVVTEDDGSPVEDAYVQACPTSGAGCSYGETGSTGRFSFTALRAGDYDVRVWPPDDDLFGGGTGAVVTGGETTELDPIALGAPEPPPPGSSITSNGTADNGVPSVDYSQALDLVITGCPGVASPTYSVVLADGTVLREQVALSETSAGRYTARVPALRPATGDASILTTVPLTCGGSPVSFDVYIDPSGVVTDQYGVPIQGATVTLSRSDTEDGPFTVVPDGSTIMSPSNRANPSTTDEVGYFRWDVQVGWYQVRAEQTGCTATTTDALEVPPERVDLLIPLECTRPAPAPATAVGLTGTPRVGETVTVRPAAWGGDIATTATELLVGGTPVALTPQGSYTFTAADRGQTVSVRSTGQRPDYVQENGDGETVVFDPVTATASAGEVAVGAAATSTSRPTVTGSPALGSTLTAGPGGWSASGLAYAYQWLRDGQAVAGADEATYVVGTDDIGDDLAVQVTASRLGYSDGTATSEAVTVERLSSTTRLSTGARTITRKTKPKVSVAVTGGVAPTGRVTVFDGRRALKSATLRDGKVTVRLPRLGSPGKHKLTARYLGSDILAESVSKKLTITVEKKRR